MIQHFHNITPSSSRRAAVRDLQNQTHILRMTRTSDMGMVRGLRGTHVRSLAISEEMAARAPTTSTIPRWG